MPLGIGQCRACHRQERRQRGKIDTTVQLPGANFVFLSSNITRAPGALDVAIELRLAAAIFHPLPTSPDIRMVSDGGSPVGSLSHWVKVPRRGALICRWFTQYYRFLRISHSEDKSIDPPDFFQPDCFVLY